MQVIALGKQVGDWLFTINVEVILGRLHADHGVPVVGSGTHDRIQIFIGDHLAVIGVAFRARFCAAFFGVRAVEKSQTFLESLLSTAVRCFVVVV